MRDERNVMFERRIASSPGPNGWLTMKLEIDRNMVKAFINNAGEPSLVVDKLNSRSTRQPGLFKGDGSGGDFKTMTINATN